MRKCYCDKCKKEITGPIIYQVHPECIHPLAEVWWEMPQNNNSDYLDLCEDCYLPLKLGKEQ